MSNALRMAVLAGSLACVAGVVVACGDSGSKRGSPDAGPPDTGVSDATSSEDTGTDASLAGDTGNPEDTGAPTGDDASSDDAPGDGPPTDGAWYLVPHPSLPLVRNNGGPVLTSPVVTAVTFNSPYLNQVSDLEAFVSTVTAQSFWPGMTTQYGVGATTVAPPIELTEAAPTAIVDSDIQAWLAAKIEGHAPGFADATNESLFVLYYPSTTSIFFDSVNDAGTGESCVAFGGYHDGVYATLDGGRPVVVAYAVIPECAPTSEDLEAGALSLADLTPLVTTHEMVEAMTDPFPNQGEGRDLAWSGTLTASSANSALDPYAAWSMVITGNWGSLELGDMCEGFGSSAYQPPGFPYYIQRTWSNDNVRASTDPCAPYRSDESAYFLAQPVFDPNFATNEPNNQFLPVVYFRTDGYTLQTQGVTIPLGTSMTIPLILWSDRPVAEPWSVAVYDPDATYGPSPYLAFSQDKYTGNAGDTINVTIKSLLVDTANGGHPFAVTSYYPGGSLYNSTFGFVSQP